MRLQNLNIKLQNECLEKLGYNSELKEKAIKNSADLIKMHVSFSCVKIKFLRNNYLKENKLF